MNTGAQGVVVARQVFSSRRVTLPTKTARRVLAAGLDATQRPSVWWSVPDPDQRAALVQVAGAESDAAHVRQVSSVWQVPIPVQVMAELNLHPQEWVYVGVAPGGSALTVTPAAGAVLTPGPVIGEES